MEPERVYTAVDVSNLFKSCRSEFGLDARVDFEVLSQLVPSIRRPNDVVQRLVAYVVASSKNNHHAFSQVLRTYGYRVRERYMRYEKGFTTRCSACGNRETTSKATRSDWDVGITVDAMDQIDTFDTFVLVSGDGDFVMLLEYMKSKGKRVIVFAFETTTARHLYEVADELYTFDKNILHNREAARGA